MAPEALVRVEHLKKTYMVDGKELRAVDDVSFELLRGRTLGLVGESGSGKSTVARCLLGLISVDGGRVRYREDDLHSMSASKLRKARQRMQVVFQDPFTSLNRSHSVERIVCAPLEAHRIGDRSSRKRRAAEILELVGLSAGVLKRKPGELSGGQAQRVAIARALALEPELVVLDEAVSSLDVSVQGQIMNLLRDLQEELDLTYLFISHDLAVVRYMSHSVAVMYLGNLVEQGERDELFSNPRHPYTRGLMEAIPVADPVLARQQEAPALIAPEDAAASPTGA